MMLVQMILFTILSRQLYSYSFDAVYDNIVSFAFLNLTDKKENLTKNIFVGIIRRLHVVVARKNVNFRGPVVLMLFLIPMKSLLKDTFNTFKAKLEWLTILNTDQLLTYMAHTILIGHGL